MSEIYESVPVSFILLDLGAKKHVFFSIFMNRIAHTGAKAPPGADQNVQNYWQLDVDNFLGVGWRLAPN